MVGRLGVSEWRLLGVRVVGLWVTQPVLPLVVEAVALVWLAGQVLLRRLVWSDRCVGKMRRGLALHLG